MKPPHRGLSSHRAAASLHQTAHAQCPASAVSTHRGVSHPLSSANSYWPSDTRPMCQPGARASPATAQGAHRSRRRRHRGGLGVDTVDMLGTGVKVEWELGDRRDQEIPGVISR